MIVGKHSALKGFSLFFYALVTILTLICCVNNGGFWSVIGIINTLVNSYVIYRLFTYFSTESSNKK